MLAARRKTDPVLTRSGNMMERAWLPGETTLELTLVLALSLSPLHWQSLEPFSLPPHPPKTAEEMEAPTGAPGRMLSGCCRGRGPGV